MMNPPILEELLHYVGFDEADGQRLRELRPLLEPALDAVVAAFYERIEAHPGARSVFRDAAQIERQKAKLRAWVAELFDGPYVEGYYDKRAEIGRAHVRVRLPQRYVVTSMHVVRTELTLALDALDALPGPRDAYVRAIHRICDVELTIMLETYRENYNHALRTAERLAALGQFAGSVAHEMRNPLAVLRTSSHLLKRHAQDTPPVRKHVERIEKQAELCGQIVDDLLALARDRPPDLERVDADALIRKAWSMIPDEEVGKRTLEIVRSPGAETLLADASQLRQVFVNLLQNATQASPDGTPIQVSVDWTDPSAAPPGDEDDGPRIRIHVDDKGPGFSSEALAHLFEPLFTTKSRGIGLGLSLCRRIVERHRGLIAVGHNEHGGARVEITLPGHEETSG